MTAFLDDAAWARDHRTKELKHLYDRADVERDRLQEIVYAVNHAGHNWDDHKKYGLPDVEKWEAELVKALRLVFNYCDARDARDALNTNSCSEEPE